MTIFKFTAPIKPISVNQAVRHGKRGSYKSQALKDFCVEMNSALSKHEVVKVSDTPVTMIVHYTLPKDEYFTKDGKIAKRHDLDNLQKYTIDSIAKYLNFNDALICQLISIKVPGDRWFIDVELRQEDK